MQGKDKRRATFIFQNLICTWMTEWKGWSQRCGVCPGSICLSWQGCSALWLLGAGNLTASGMVSRYPLGWPRPAIVGPRTGLAESRKAWESKAPVFDFDRAVMNNSTSTSPTNAQDFVLWLRKKTVLNSSLRISTQERKVKYLLWKCGNYAQEEQRCYGKQFS